MMSVCPRPVERARAMAMVLAASVVIMSCAGAAGVREPEPRESRPRDPAAQHARAGAPIPEPPAVRLDSESPEVAAMLAACADMALDRTGAVIHLGGRDGVDLFQIHGVGADQAKEGAIMVAAGALGPGAATECVRLHKGASGTRGEFWPGRGMSRADLYGASECHPEFCPMVVIIRGDDAVLGGALVHRICDRGTEIETVRWFAGQDSVKLICRQSMGAAYRELATIIHGTRHGLQPVLEVDKGVREHASLEERETPGFCERKPVGWVRLVTRGDRPVVRVFDPGRGEAGRNGTGQALQAELRFDPGSGRFEQVGQGTLVEYDARAWCKTPE